MTNREKYAKEILNIACAGKRIAVKNGVPCDCSATECGECDLSQGNSHCSGELAADDELNANSILRADGRKEK